MWPLERQSLGALRGENSGVRCSTQADSVDRLMAELPNLANALTGRARVAKLDR